MSNSEQKKFSITLLQGEPDREGAFRREKEQEKGNTENANTNEILNTTTNSTRNIN